MNTQQQTKTINISRNIYGQTGVQNTNGQYSSGQTTGVQNTNGQYSSGQTGVQNTSAQYSSGQTTGAQYSSGQTTGIPNATQGVQTPPQNIQNALQAIPNAPQNIQQNAPHVSDSESDTGSDESGSDESGSGTWSDTGSEKDFGLGFEQPDVKDDDSSLADGQNGGDYAESEYGGSSVSTAEILAKDPLFLVLSEFFMDEEGNTIVHALSKIGNNIEKLNKNIERLCSRLDKKKSKS